MTDMEEEPSCQELESLIPGDFYQKNSGRKKKQTNPPPPPPPKKINVKKKEFWGTVYGAWETGGGEVISA